MKSAQLFMFPEARPTLQPHLIDGFEQFWVLFPHKVSKGQARRAWGAAIRKIPLEQLLDGLRRYIAEKPHDTPWCNPATFLNGERWADVPATAKNRTGDSDAVRERRLRSCAELIARGINVASVTRSQAAEMVARGWLTAEQAKRAGY